MKFWIARSDRGLIAIYKRKPHKRYDAFTKNWDWRIENSTGDYMCLPDYSFPEVTFENSPQEVELKLVNKIVGVAESPLKTFPRVNEFETGASYRR